MSWPGWVNAPMSGVVVSPRTGGELIGVVGSAGAELAGASGCEVEVDVGALLDPLPAGVPGGD